MAQHYWSICQILLTMNKKVLIFRDHFQAKLLLLLLRKGNMTSWLKSIFSFFSFGFNRSSLLQVMGIVVFATYLFASCTRFTLERCLLWTSSDEQHVHPQRSMQRKHKTQRHATAGLLTHFPKSGKRGCLFVFFGNTELPVLCLGQ